jgi:hypothetical protein
VSEEPPENRFELFDETLRDVRLVDDPPSELDIDELYRELNSNGAVVLGVTMLAALFMLGLVVGLALGWWLL